MSITRLPGSSVRRGAVRVVQRVVVYARQSRSKTKSITEQIDECSRDVVSLEHAVDAVYSDGGSATRGTARRSWQQLLQDLAAGKIDMLVIWEISRSDRSARRLLTVIEQCAAAGILIRVTSAERTYNPQQPADWRELANQAVDAESEVKRLGQRVSRGLAANAEAGLPHAKAPFGYMREYHPHSGELVGQFKDERPRGDGQGSMWTAAGVVEQIYTDIKGKKHIAEIARGLNDRGIPAPRRLAAMDAPDPRPRKYEGAHDKKCVMDRWQGLLWTDVTVRHIATNSVYLGYRSYHGQVIVTDPERTWPSLVDLELFDEVQAILGDPNRRTNGASDYSARYLLTCIMTCFTCHREMVYLKPTPAERENHRRLVGTYRCRASHVAVPAAEAEVFVSEFVLAWLGDVENWQRIRTSEADTSREVTAARSEIARRSAELSVWQAALDGDEEIDPIDAARRKRRLVQAIEQAREVVRRAGIPQQFREFVGRSASEIRIIWDESDLARRRALIRTLCDVSCRSVGKGRRNVPIDERLHIQPLYFDN